MSNNRHLLYDEFEQIMWEEFESADKRLGIQLKLFKNGKAD